MRQHERLAEKVTILQDTLHEIQDLMGQITEQTEKRLQALLAVTHECVASYERSLGRNR